VALISVLRTSQPLTKNQLQKLFLNLCSHSATRRSILQMLLSLIRAQAAEQEQQQAGVAATSAAAATAAAAEASSPATRDMEVSTGGAPPAQEQPTGQGQQQQLQPGRTSISAVLDTLDEQQQQQPAGGAQPAAAGAEAPAAAGADAAAQAGGAGGGQAVLSRRVLEMSTYLARASKQVADLLLLLPVPADTPVTRPPRAADTWGKRVPEPEQPEASQPKAVEVLLQVRRRAGAGTGRWHCAGAACAGSWS
jgi:hypothetical protein